MTQDDIIKNPLDYDLSIETVGKGTLKSPMNGVPFVSENDKISLTCIYGLQEEKTLIKRFTFFKELSSWRVFLCFFLYVYNKTFQSGVHDVKNLDSCPLRKHRSSFRLFWRRQKSHPS